MEASWIRVRDPKGGKGQAGPENGVTEDGEKVKGRVVRWSADVQEPYRVR